GHLLSRRSRYDGQMTRGKSKTVRRKRLVSSKPTVIPGGHWPRFIDGQSPAFKVLAVHFRNSFVSAVLHFYETKTFRATGVAISDDTDRLNRTCLVKQVLEIILRGFKRQISDIQLLFHGITSLI